MLSLATYDETATYTLVCDKINIYLLYIFTAEQIIKIIVYHKKLFKDRSNIFDFCIVIGSWIGLTLPYFVDIDIGNIAIIIRTFRIARIVRLL